MRRALLALAGAALLASPLVAAPLEAQGRRESRVPRRIIFTGLGFLISSAAVSAYAIAGEEGNGHGTCSSRACVIPVTVGTGTIVGYMIGREFDQLHAIRYRGGAPLSIPSVTAPAGQSALLLAARDTLVAVTGPTGVQLYASQRGGLRPLGRRAGGVRGITALDLTPGGNALAVASPAGFYVYPPSTGPGVLIREGSAAAVSAAGDRFYFGIGSRVEVAPVGADTTRQWPGVDVGTTVTAMHHDAARGILWAGGDSTIVALAPNGDSLAIVGRARVEGAVRSLHGAGDRLAVTLGEGGLVVLDVATPEAAREATRWKGARFIYDAAFVSPVRLLAGAGPDGMYVLDLSTGSPTVVGLARELGFVTTIVVRGSQAFLLDRQGDLVRRIETTSF